MGLFPEKHRCWYYLFLLLDSILAECLVSRGSYFCLGICAVERYSSIVFSRQITAIVLCLILRESMFRDAL